MPKVQINLPKDAHEILKQKAKEDYRSLINYITTQLIKIANGTLQTVDTSVVPEGTKITTKTQKPLTPEEIEEQQIYAFQKRAKAVLGQELDLGECTLVPTNRYYDFAEEREGKVIRMPYTMSIEKQREYLEEWKHYIKK